MPPFSFFQLAKLSFDLYNSHNAIRPTSSPISVTMPEIAKTVHIMTVTSHALRASANAAVTIPNAHENIPAIADISIADIIPSSVTSGAN